MRPRPRSMTVKFAISIPIMLTALLVLNWQSRDTPIQEICKRNKIETWDQFAEAAEFHWRNESPSFKSYFEKHENGGTLAFHGYGRRDWWSQKSLYLWKGTFRPTESDLPMADIHITECGELAYMAIVT